MSTTHPHHALTFNGPPKRKRGLPAISTIPPTPPRSSPMPEDTLPTSYSPYLLPPPQPPRERDGRAASPRAGIACNFQALRLEDAGTGARSDFGLPSRSREKESGKGMGVGWPRACDERMDEDGDRNGSGNDDGARKRAKLVKMERREVPETPQPPQFRMFVAPPLERTMDPVVGKITTGNEFDQMIFRGSPALVTRNTGRAYPLVYRLAESKSRKKRAGTPPLISLARKAGDGRVEGVVDEERAANTWHDDEITGHDPSDPEDDGEGINGIGFKPTAAEAYVRTQKRRKQMAAYKNREEQERRQSRIDRRRGSQVTKAAKMEQENARRVRFGEMEATKIVWT
ncbi:hypothetical protein MBM_04040 [Drepanopeziza brunnea f. sp. 'multigermtubi' MB_m1]|uniref:Uncharacterized protein n=2 Tax=Drepanopeziza brunnea f. sp. 'multigermtubi' TaxID=698441 RepID=K1WX99_MARBU|nr:uncharacterized protein MBM_04040 [Drepanopeziza brunnea f. sp. 'multigermtubi' MB_m1]EKD17671.1 hypothetical protein MBM_04040 [Drepanopeziza brunnea f. sp. 'multigermtubi' MB_m1]